MKNIMWINIKNRKPLLLEFFAFFILFVFVYSIWYDIFCAITEAV